MKIICCCIEYHLARALVSKIAIYLVWLNFSENLSQRWEKKNSNAKKRFHRFFLSEFFHKNQQLKSLRSSRSQFLVDHYRIVLFQNKQRCAVKRVAISERLFFFYFSGFRLLTLSSLSGSNLGSAWVCARAHKNEIEWMRNLNEYITCIWSFCVRWE